MSNPIGSFVGSYIAKFIGEMLLAAFSWLMTPAKDIFIAELQLVVDFAKDDRLVFGGTFQSLIKFNAFVIPGMASAVFLVWLVAKGLTGGNSKTSMEEMLKRVMGAMVISMVLSLLVNPAEQVVGALDGALLSLVQVNSQGLTRIFAVLALASSTVSPVGIIVLSLIIIFCGMVLAGLLVTILLFAHAAAFILIYFAPYLTLFRRDGFRESVEGLGAAIATPFMVTSVLAIGIATMGATGTLEPVPAALGQGVHALTAMFGGHAVVVQTQLVGNSQPVAPSNLVTLIANSLSGLLILVAAIFLPPMLIAKVFQSAHDFHGALQAGHKELAGKVTSGISGAEGKFGKAAERVKSAFGRSGSANAASSSSSGVSAPGEEAVDRSALADSAIARSYRNPGPAPAAAAESDSAQAPSGAYWAGPVSPSAAASSAAAPPTAAVAAPFVAFAASPALPAPLFAASAAVPIPTLGSSNENPLEAGLSADAARRAARRQAVLGMKDQQSESAFAPTLPESADEAGS